MFIEHEYQTAVYGEDGDVSVPIISAYDEEPKWNETFKECLAVVVYPGKNRPMIVKLDYKQIEGQKIDVTQYSRVIQKLNELGAHVDNSFVHYYRYKKESISLDGILCDTYTISMRINSTMHRKHAINDYRHRIMDVFFLNSIACGNTEIDGKFEELTKHLGKENVIRTGDSIIFSVPKKDLIIGNYRIQNLKSIIGVNKLLSSNSQQL